MKDRQVHAGVQVGRDVKFVRPSKEQLRSTLIDAFIDIILDTKTPITWVEIDKVVDEGLSSIQPLQDDQIYSVKTNGGKFGLLCNKGFPNTAEQIKELLRDKHRLVAQSGISLVKN